MQLPAYPHLPENAPSLDLGGKWAYAQPVLDHFAESPLKSESFLHVPGEVVMQGLPFDQSASFALERLVEIPDDWHGAIHLRFESVYSACRVWIDGKAVAQHLGGFTPFDLDLSQHARPGATIRVTLHVDNDSIADTVAYASKYAAHPLAGILRKVTLYSLPEAHLRSFAASTIFEQGRYDRAKLRVELEVSAPGTAVIELRRPGGSSTELTSQGVKGAQVLEFEIDHPELWNTEHPKLHTLAIQFGGATYTRRIGFRDVRVDGGKLLLNGQSIVLRGINHHETHPTTGRADTARWAETDVALFRAAHVNMFRTSHYPPTIELVEACDAAGMLIEMEAPVCFAFGQFGHMKTWDALTEQERIGISDYVVAASLEMVSFYRSHPSVIIWSIGNESKWAPPFERSSAAIRASDPTRPLTFNWYKNGPECRDHVQIANHHYPDSGEVARFAEDPRPVLFDEFGHLFCYNGHELATDPGLRLRWGELFTKQWEEMRSLPNGIGGSIWAGLDDFFAVPQTDGSIAWKGYGQWGPIDGWRRPKPEYEQLKDAFDPIKVVSAVVRGGEPICIEVENRFDFADLSELEVAWHDQVDYHPIALKGSPGARAVIELPGEARNCELRFVHKALKYSRVVQFRAEARAIPKPAFVPLAPEVGDGFTALGRWRVRDAGLGPLIENPAGDRIPMSLAIVPAHPSWQPGQKPAIAPVPLSNMVSDWKLDFVRGLGDRVEISGRYNIGKGLFTISATAEGLLRLHYEFTLEEGIEPFQTGLCFSVPLSWEILEWRLGDHSIQLPPDHIGRATGKARAFGQSDFPPQGAWMDDASPWGTNDFRSTKLGVERAGVFAEDGRGLCMHSHGEQHARAQVDRDTLRFFALDYSSQGSERFLDTFTTPLRMEVGSVLAGVVDLSFHPSDWRP